MTEWSETMTPASSSGPGLGFLWLELTHRCNLQCVHCYSESGPHTSARDVLGPQQYQTVMAEARALGCARIQFIGGEPTLNRNLPVLIARARELDFEYVEVFTNLAVLHDSLLRVLIRHRVAVATSFYSKDPDAHDRVTATPGSHRRTVANMVKVLKAGLALRVGLIEIEGAGDETEATVAYLRQLGVENISRDHVRGFGRAGASCSLDELCGNCAGDVLAVGPDGVVAPCIMSRQWAVGSVLETSLRDVVHSERLKRTRRAIAVATANQRSCGPDPNCGPNCSPNAQCSPCAPNGGWKCLPNGNCNPGQ